MKLCATRGCLGWWRRLWGPDQFQMSSPQSLRHVSGRFARIRRPCRWTSARAGVYMAQSWVDLIHGLERVTLIGVDLDRMFHILHSLFYVKVDLYSTSRNLCYCQVKLPTEGLPPVVEIPHKTFALWRSVRAMPQVHHVRLLGGISLPDWQTMPCNRVGNTA